MSRWRGLTALLSATALAWTGTRLAGIAVPWFVLTTTGSPVLTGVVVFAQMGPYVIAQALAGPLIDRVGAKRISVIGDLVSASAMGTIPVLYALGSLPFPVLLALLAVVGMAEGPGNASKGVMVPEVVEQAQVPIERATGLMSTIERTASTLGPAIGGVVVAAWGGAASLAITAGLSVVGALVIAVGMPTPRPPETVDDTGYLERLREGAAFLRTERLLRSIITMVAVTNLIDMAVFSVLVPVWAFEAGYGPEVIGLLAGVMSGFAIVSSLISSAIGHRLPRRRTYLIAYLIAGFPRMAILAISAPLPVIVAVYGMSGFAGGVLNPILGAVQFELIPRELLGRVRSLATSLAWVGIPFGGLVGGALVAGIGVSAALITSGAAYFVATILPALRPEWKRMDSIRRAESSAGSSEPLQP